MHKHSGVKPYLCQHCEKAYYTAPGLEIHINKVHLNKRDFSCHECDKHFTTKGKYFFRRRFLVLVQSSKGIAFTRYQCNGNIKFIIYLVALYLMLFILPLGELTRHLKFGAAHMTEDMAAVCHLCGKSFANKIRLKVHLMGFHGNSMKACPHCGKYFKTLEVHIAHMHGSQPVGKTYKCFECEQRFKTKSLLCDHRQNAHGIQSWHRCNRCDNKFTSASRLQSHIKVVHLKEKAKCPGCGKEFSEMDSVKKHIKAGRCKGALDEATREQYLSNVCPRCKKQFGMAKVLTKHLETCGVDQSSIIQQ